MIIMKIWGLSQQGLFFNTPEYTPYMKLLITLALQIILPLYLYSQDTSNHKLMGIVPYENLSVRYKGVIEAPGLTATDIYNRAKKWVAQNYRSSKDVIQLNNKETGEIIVKGYATLKYSHPLYAGIWRSYHILLIQIKDGKYRYEMTVPSITTTVNMSDENTPTYYVRHLSSKNSNKFLIALDQTSRATLQSLEDNIKSAQSDNW